MGRKRQHGEHAGYRDRLPAGRREPRGVLRYDDIEWAAIAAAAAINGMHPGAWAQQAAFTAASDTNTGPVAGPAAVHALLEELRQHRRVLLSIGNNVNQLAAHANTTGQLAARPAETVLRMIRDVVYASDTMVAQIRTQLRLR